MNAPFIASVVFSLIAISLLICCLSLSSRRERGRPFSAVMRGLCFAIAISALLIAIANLIWSIDLYTRSIYAQQIHH